VVRNWKRINQEEKRGKIKSREYPSTAVKNVQRGRPI
jgi:hypothetical protein